VNATPDSPTRGYVAIRIAAAVASYLAVPLVHVHVGLVRADLSEAVGWIGVASLVLLPFVAHGLAHLDRDLPPRVRLAPHLLQVVPVTFLPLDRPGLLLFALGVAIQGNLLARTRSPRAVPWSLAAGLALFLAGLAIAPSPLWFPLFPLVLFTSLTGLLLAQDRLVAERVRGRLARRAADHAPPVPRGFRGAAIAARYALALGALVLVSVPVLLALYAALPRPFLASGTEPGGGAQEAGRGEPTGETSEVAEAGRVFDEIFQSGVTFGRGGDTAVLGEDVMELRPRPDGPDAPPRAVGPVYLRGIPLDTFETRGMVWSGGSPPAPLDDAADGVEDGWTRLAGTGSEEALLLEVRQQPVFIQDGERSILFAPERTLAIDRGGIRHAPDGLLVTTEPPRFQDEWIAYRLLVEERRAERLDLARASLATGRGTDLQLPPPSDALRFFRETAGELTRNATTDVERVWAIVDHLRGFEYSLAVQTYPDLGGLVEFMRRRRGFCTYFATSAALLLRTQGIPCRVATGFLGGEWSEEEGCSLVTTRDRHAWIEVRFEDLGWVTFDPTPASGRGGSARRDPSSGLGAWAAEVLHDMRRWMASGDDGWLSTLLSTLADLPAALWKTICRHPVLSIALVVLLLGGGLWRRRRRVSGGSGAVAEARSGDPVESLYERILAALGRLGHHRRPPQTPREFAREVFRRGGEEYEPLRTVTDVLYRSRYGGIAPGVTELEEARTHLRYLRNRPAIPGKEAAADWEPEREPLRPTS